MSSAGSVLAAIKRIKDNRSLRPSEKSRFKDGQVSYTSKPTKLKYKKLSKKDQKIFNTRIREMVKSNDRLLLSRTLFVLLFVLASLAYWMYF